MFDTGIIRMQLSSSSGPLFLTTRSRDYKYGSQNIFCSRVAYGDTLMEDSLKQRRLCLPNTPLVDVPVFGVDAKGQVVPIPRDT